MAETEDTEEKQQEAVRRVEVTNGAVRIGCSGGPWEDPSAVQTPASHPSLVTDSEWLDLSAGEQLAWAKNTQDPRIAVGSQSPLEKKIKRLGDAHSTEVRKLLIQTFQQESKMLHKLKALSPDIRFAKAEEYYCQYQETLREARKHTAAPKPEVTIKEEEKPAQNENTEDAKIWDYLVSERELNEIKKHIYRIERARGIKDHKYRLFPQRITSEVLPPKTFALEKDEKMEYIQKTPKAKTKKHQLAWAQAQIKKHQDRMIRGRELTELRDNKQGAQELTTHAPPFLKAPVGRAERKEFEWVTAYPLAQPHPEAPREVTVLMEKSEEGKIDKPLPREFLSIPPFLRSQLENNKVKIL